LDRGALDFVVEGRGLFATAGATAAVAAAFDLLKSRAVSDGGVLATCGATAAGSDVVAGETRGASTGSGRGSGCGGPDIDGGESETGVPRCAIASTAR
jgi:hypothetical protein